MVGHTIAHFRVLESIGAGGMGEVFLAEDERLGRRVALKLLPLELTRDAAARARFLQEARAASALDHPSICTVYESGETPDGQAFLAMAHYPGDTLEARIARGPLAVADALEIASQVADGLAEAHTHGIVHRDIKPANLILAQNGRVKIVDFGLARLTECSVVTTGAGVAVGTLAYMAPEQARGETADARADLWALGVVLYEMLAGRRPFAGDTGAALLYAIVNAAPAPLDRLRTGLPATVLRVVNRSLTKDLFGRYQQAEQMLADLQASKSALSPSAGTRSPNAPPRVPSIAVLPFADLSPERNQEHFCDGIAEELINSLSGIGGLRVTSRTSAAQFKGQAQDVRRIGEQLNVDTILEGSVRKAGNRLRVTAQLVNASDGYHLWSERYDRTLDDIFEVQDGIARVIVEKLKGQLIDGSSAVARQLTRSVEAYQHYLQGRYHYERRHRGTLAEAVACFEAAIRVDPGFAAAHAGLSDAYSMLIYYGFAPPSILAPKARDEVEHALALDDSLAEAHHAMGVFKLFVEFDFDGLERSFTRAMELNPALAVVRAYYALALAITPRASDLRRVVARALELDPVSPLVGFLVGVAFYVARDYQDALRQTERVLALEPDHVMALWVRGVSLLQLKRYEEALASTGRAVELANRHAYFLAIHAIALARAGRLDDARAILDELRDRATRAYVDAMTFVVLPAALGEMDEALAQLEYVIASGYPGTPLTLARPELDSIRADPRFARLVAGWLGDSPVAATLTRRASART